MQPVNDCTASLHLTPLHDLGSLLGTVVTTTLLNYNSVGADMIVRSAALLWLSFANDSHSLGRSRHSYGCNIVHTV